MLRTRTGTIAAYTFLEAIRNRLVWLVAVFIFAGFALAEFVGEVAITESVAFQSGFLGALLRVCAVFTVALFVITSMVRELDDKVLELVLSLPIPRSSYFLGKLLGFSFLAVLIAIPCGLVLLLYAPPGQVALWASSLLCELLLVTALSLLCLFTFNQVTLALSTVMAFYVLARSIDALRLMAKNPIVGTDSVSQRVIEAFIDALAYLLPELSRFGSSEWLVYHTGTWTDLAPIVGQSAVYVALLAGAALFDLYRKNL